jgi:hypothetical protein
MLGKINELIIAEYSRRMRMSQRKTIKTMQMILAMAEQKTLIFSNSKWTSLEGPPHLSKLDRRKWHNMRFSG